jgi:FkbM family methyltransferase
VKYHPEFGVYYMGEGDPYVFTEQRRDYGKIAHMAEGRNVLDFGAHCGFFNVFVSRTYPPAKIVSVEPDERSHPALEKNMRADTILLKAAVVDKSYEGSHIPLFLGGTYASKTTTEPVRGRDTVLVPVVKFQRLLRAHKIGFIKCDCEGGEYKLDWHDLPDTVKAIALEYHFRRPEWEAEMNAMDKVLLDQGFHHVHKPKFNGYSKISKGMYAR